MPFLEPHHIVGLRRWVDIHLPTQDRDPSLGGRPSILRDSDLVTILVWNAVAVHQKTVMDVYTFTRLHLHHLFPRLPKYRGFLDQCHRVAPQMYLLLQELLCTEDPIKIGDSTMVPVCKLHRADRHRVAKTVAAFGKNHQGWHYGFKLHLSITLRRELSSVVLTDASVYDGQVSEIIFNTRTKMGVGDSHYGARVMCEHLWERSQTFVLSPPHYKQRRKIMAPWQQHFLGERSKIEATIDVLKEHLHLVTSFPRSVRGYLVHYARILLGYQILALSCVT
jgi:hypothetical protein